MFRLLIDASLLAVVLGMKCPGSPSFFHASAEVVAIADASCADVKEEMLGRVQSSPWTDPHNAGTYSVLPSKLSSQLDFSRLTGDKKYTDKLTITLADASGKCMIMGCSESQVFSIFDFSTNFCNLRNLYCGPSDGCQPVKHDFRVVESRVTASPGAGSDAKSCITTLTL
ncbi:unnamed protein product [Symbiodinium pilosum]|uniref:Secreted protein n=1 Tax=Symbiodinium pilosum TaxID=2952 RepID=A0A812VTH7_SYMPI|nr:unnamed protein product [Symbiodinium pilosum]